MGGCLFWISDGVGGTRDYLFWISDGMGGMACRTTLQEWKVVRPQQNSVCTYVLHAIVYTLPRL